MTRISILLATLASFSATVRADDASSRPMGMPDLGVKAHLVEVQSSLFLGAGEHATKVQLTALISASEPPIKVYAGGRLSFVAGAGRYHKDPETPYVGPTVENGAGLFLGQPTLFGGVSVVVLSTSRGTLRMGGELAFTLFRFHSDELLVHALAAQEAPQRAGELSNLGTSVRGIASIRLEVRRVGFQVSGGVVNESTESCHDCGQDHLAYGTVGLGAAVRVAAVDILAEAAATVGAYARVSSLDLGVRFRDQLALTPRVFFLTSDKQFIAGCGVSLRWGR